MSKEIRGGLVLVCVAVAIIVSIFLFPSMSTDAASALSLVGCVIGVLGGSIIVVFIILGQFNYTPQQLLNYLFPPKSFIYEFAFLTIDELGQTSNGLIGVEVTRENVEYIYALKQLDIYVVLDRRQVPKKQLQVFWNNSRLHYVPCTDVRGMLAQDWEKQVSEHLLHLAKEPWSFDQTFGKAMQRELNRIRGG